MSDNGSDDVRVTSIAAAIRAELMHRAARTPGGYPGGQAAEDIGVSKQVFSYWKRGERVPANAHVRSLARWLRMPIRDVTALIDAQRNPEQRLLDLERRADEMEAALVEIRNRLRRRAAR